MKCQFRIFREDGPEGAGWYECFEQDDSHCANILRGKNVCRSHRVHLTRDNISRHKQGIDIPNNFDLLKPNKFAIKKCTIKVEGPHPNEESAETEDSGSNLA